MWFFEVTRCRPWLFFMISKPVKSFADIIKTYRLSVPSNQNFITLSYLIVLIVWVMFQTEQVSRNQRLKPEFTIWPSWLKLKLNWHYNRCTHDTCGLTAIPRISHISHIRQQTQKSPYTDTHSRLLSRNWNSRDLYKTRWCPVERCVLNKKDFIFVQKRRVHAGRIN